MIINEKKRKKALLKNSKNLKAIHDKYYESKMFTNTVADRTYTEEHYVYHVEQIMDEFNINSIAELIFLLHKYCGKIVKVCEFCNHEITEIKTRTGRFNNLDDCDCKGICQTCKKIYKYCSDIDGICSDCKPYDYEGKRIEYLRSPESISYRFMQYIGDPVMIEHIESVEELQLMMEVAKEAYHLFGETLENLQQRKTVDQDV